jgi:hypothetical protein
MLRFGTLYTAWVAVSTDIFVGHFLTKISEVAPHFGELAYFDNVRLAEQAVSGFLEQITRQIRS